MTTGRSQIPPSSPRSDPARVLGWLGVAALGVLILLNAAVPAPEIADALRFDPARPVARPWALVTYPLVHTGLGHLLGVAGLVALVGPAVARRMGSRTLLAYLVAAVAGGAAFGIALAALFDVPPLAGGLAPAYGLLLARGWYGEEEEVSLDPLPFRARIRTLVGLGAGALMVAGLVADSPPLSVAHAGGLLAGLLWFRIRSVSRRPLTSSPLPARRPVMTPVRLEVQESSATLTPAPPAASPSSPSPVRPTPRSEAEELDRLLDKISEQGFESLTEQERRSLSELAERKKKGGDS